MSHRNIIRQWNQGNDNFQKLSIDLHSLREATNFDVGNIVANGGVLASDTTPVLSAINDATDGCQRLLWATGNVDQVITQLALPGDLSPRKDLKIKFRGKMSGTADTPLFTATLFFNESDTAVVATNDATADPVTDSYAEHEIKINAADIPSDAQTVSIGLDIGAHGTDTFEITALWLEYSSTYQLPKQ